MADISFLRQFYTYTSMQLSEVLVNKEFELVQLRVIALKEYEEEDRTIPKIDSVHSAAGSHDNITLLLMLDEKN